MIKKSNAELNYHTFTHTQIENPKEVVLCSLVQSLREVGHIL